ncbi:MAG: rhamnogalacturonan lyase [Prevotellaceae bacterium]|nr:rhamnogalacturonan lyase [Prevotellaceae bacterium]
MRKDRHLQRTIVLSSLMAVSAFALRAQTVVATWEFSDIENQGACAITADGEPTTILTDGFALGANLSPLQTLTNSGADTGYTAVQYDPAFTTLQPSEKVTSATDGHEVTFTLTPAEGHKFRPSKVSFDACKVGTDGGGIDVVVGDGTGATTALGSVTPLRNKIMDGNSTGYSHHEFYVNDYNVEGTSFVLTLYIMNVADNKEMGLRNITIEGEMDSEILSVGDYISSFQFTSQIGKAEPTTIDLLSNVADLKNGESTHYYTKLSAEPTDFSVELCEAYSSTHTAEVTYADRTATVNIEKDGTTVLTFSVSFSVSILPDKGEATPLKRGLMALHSSSGNLVSWRARATDDRNLKFLLYRSTATSSETVLNGGEYITGKTNFLDKTGTASHYYRLEVVDADGNVIETDSSAQTWDSQTLYIPLTAGAPTDPSGNGATYTPNDASYCDMDGDGEYEIILKWYPSNAKDAASSGTTSNIFFDCYKLDGTQLWRIDMGQNFFASAHTVQFIAWDFDGDGYGEFMVKTAPGTIDGQGNYVIMDGDDPTANWKNSNGKQTEGPEYISVFDGSTGAELATIPYHTTYADGVDVWGDSNQNRSERYLAAIAWLDGEDANPSPIFARGYYAAAFVGAYNWDGTTLSERWVSRNTTKNQGLWGEGAHWISVADCDGDGKQEIVYGAAALDDDGTLLYRTGLGHGDALHVGDFDPDNDGLEVYQAHEDSPYGADLRDAATGTILWHPTASSDTGRAIAAHFNPESEGAYFQLSSAMSNLYDWNGTVIKSDVSHGGGGSLNNRVYWDGLLSDCHYDKSVLERYNPSSNTFDRIQVNGTNYTIGTLNNDTKYNPCVLGDILGDWREEIVTWSQDGDTYYLIINATNYESDYTVPHLMDDPGYRAQVISQNVCYNQPPHLDYNLRESKKITRQCLETKSETGETTYWDCLYTTYPVQLPDGVTAWKVTGCQTADGVDTLLTTRLTSGARIAANTGIVYRSSTPEVTFVPSSLSANAMSGSVIEGSYCDTLLPSDTETQASYVFGIGDRGPGFYQAGGTEVEHGSGYITFTGTDAAPLAESYVVGASANSVVAVSLPEADAAAAPAIYNLQGIRLGEAPQKGIYIVDGKKKVK